MREPGTHRAQTGTLAWAPGPYYVAWHRNGTARIVNFKPMLKLVAQFFMVLEINKVTEGRQLPGIAFAPISPLKRMDGPS